MKFMDYFKASHDKEVTDKKRADNQGGLYQLYFNYIIYDLDDYSHADKFNINKKATCRSA